MHFDGNLYAMVGGKFPMLNPIGRHHLVPLPVEDFEEVGRPWAGDPVGGGRVGRVARTAREIHHHGNAQLFSEQDGLAARLASQLGAGLVGMQRVAVATERADGRAVIGQHLLKLGKGGAVLEHGELAVRIAGIAARAKLHGRDVEGFQFIENGSKRKLRKQRREDSNAHDGLSLSSEI
jgi:hypothetical protein